MATTGNRARTDITNEIDSLIQMLVDGARFYHTASSRTQDIYLQQLFQQMIDLKYSGIVRLTPFSGPRSHGVAERESLTGAAGRILAEIEAVIGDTDDVLLTSLIRNDEAIIGAVDDVSKKLAAGVEREALGDLKAEFTSALADVKAAEERVARET